MPLSLRLSFAVLLVLYPLTRLDADATVAWPDRSDSLSLNGTWQFAYLAGPGAGIRPDRFDPVAVPGHWELQGFAEPKYGKDLAEGLGCYRRTFRVPATWKGRRIMLRFDGVLFGFDVFVNGAKAGSWATGYNPVTFDVTDQLQWDADNELAVDVTTRSHGWEFDTNDCWSLSGIYRDVTLFAVPAAHLQYYTTATVLAPDGSATLSVTAVASAPTGLRGRVLGPDAKAAGELTFPPSEGTCRVAALRVPHPRLWTAETPALYTLELTLASGQTIVERIGLREVKIVDGVLQLNGRPIKLRGVDHHDLWPDTGRATDEAKLRRDLELIRAANCNFVRTSHYPPHPRLLELCDELGLYVMDEVPFGFGEDHLSDEAYRGDLRTRAEATVRRDANHASVILWSVGNENPNTPLTIATARRAKELDPTRPVCFPQIGSYFAKHYQELPEDIDVYAPHYPSLATVKDYATTLTRPVIFTEYAHALGLAADQVQAQWAVIQASPRLAGGAIWMFQDQGILRAAKPGETPASSHDLGLNVWTDAQHYHDVHGNQGMDGIVYPDRTPQPDYFEVRKVYSPVQISARPLALQPGRNHVELSVENRFDFRSLDGVALNWELRRNGAAIQSGRNSLRAESGHTEKVSVALTLPADAAGDLFTLALRCTDRDQPAFYERSLRLETPALRAGLAAMIATRSAKTTKTQLTVRETPGAIRVGHPDFSLTVLTATGEMTLADATGRILAHGLGPHAGRRFTEGEFMRAAKELTWTNAPLQPAILEASATPDRADVVVRVRGHYARSEAAGQGVVGGCDVRVHPDGTLDVSYDYTVESGRGLLLEAGFALRVPAAATEFRWIGDGPYAGYPGKDVLNEFGAFHLHRDDLYFQGNRRHVELALLTDADGRGIALSGESADVAVERDGDTTQLSHNAVVSGRGTKFVGPDVAANAEERPHLAGKFTLRPLAGRWPEALRRWFDSPRAARPFQPYFHSYDQ